MGANVGMPEVGLAVMTTSSGLLLLLIGLCSVALYALFPPGEFSLRNEEGSLERGVSRVGEPNLPLPPFEDGVDGIGDAGKDLSSNGLLTKGGRRGDGDDHSGDFCGVASSALRSESELRLFFFGGPVGMKLGCSPIVDRPRFCAVKGLVTDGCCAEIDDIVGGPS